MSKRIYTAELGERILMHVSEGKSLRTICKAPDMPSPGAIRAWVVDDVDGFAARFGRARAIGIAGLADEILEISDDGSNDTTTDAAGNLRVDTEWVQRSKLRVESRRWLLSKLLPKEYGEKVELEHSGVVGLGLDLASMIKEGRRRARGELSADWPATTLPTITAEIAAPSMEDRDA